MSQPNPFGITGRRPRAGARIPRRGNRGWRRHKRGDGELSAGHIFLMGA
jgi:hypothetical protein